MNKLKKLIIIIIILKLKRESDTLLELVSTEINCHSTRIINTGSGLPFGLPHTVERMSESLTRLQV